MLRISRASIYFMERAGLLETRRGPVPKLSVSINSVHQFPMTNPYPAAAFRVEAQGNPAPDRGLTTPFAD